MITTSSKAAGGCCTPSGTRQEAATAPSGEQTIRRGEPRAQELTDMVSLPGGTFLMGSDSAESFAQDGEGPVRPVTINPFHMDAFPVTNEQFGRFVMATGYRTEAERLGWSFVFWSHIPQVRFAELVADTVAGASWWCQVRGARWDAP